MIVDTSAIVAIVQNERGAESFIKAIRGSRSVQMSAATYLELSIVIDRIGDPVLSRRLDELLAELGIVVVDVSPRHARIAREAYRDFGKGTGHPAGLNFGDCFSYALAVGENDVLLFKGDDFGATDVMSADLPGHANGPQE